jgi:hypothetical protein
MNKPYLPNFPAVKIAFSILTNLSMTFIRLSVNLIFN